MGAERAAADLELFLAERGEPLLRTAALLAGSREAGEDLLQAALERVLRKPRQVDSDIEGYLRRVLYNLAADGWRRRGRWQQKLPLFRSQDSVAGADGTGLPMAPADHGQPGRTAGHDPARHDPGRLPHAAPGRPASDRARHVPAPRP